MLTAADGCRHWLQLQALTRASLLLLLVLWVVLGVLQQAVGAVARLQHQQAVALGADKHRVIVKPQLVQEQRWEQPHISKLRHPEWQG
jgi:ABC-type phosphate transport system permease subunit